jgi:hypothetical protein
VLGFVIALLAGVTFGVMSKAAVVMVAVRRSALRAPAQHQYFADEIAIDAQSVGASGASLAQYLNLRHPFRQEAGAKDD